MENLEKKTETQYGLFEKASDVLTAGIFGIVILSGMAILARMFVSYLN